jgi:transcriptional regulator with XRE-family HTH domain
MDTGTANAEVCSPMADQEMETNRIRVLMREKGVSQHELARRLGMTQAQVSRLLAGKSEWKVQRWRDALKVLGATENDKGELKKPADILKSLESSALDFLDAGTKQRLGNLARRFHLKHSDGTPDLIAALKISIGIGLDQHEAQFRGDNGAGSSDE